MTTALIPDTLQGALLLSVIDFFLSFFVISFIGLVLAGFPVLNRIGGWVTARSRAAAAAKKARLPRPASPAAPAANPEIPLEDVVAITAAVAVIMGEHVILHIEPQRSAGTGWLVAGRQGQHLSHAPPPRPAKR